MRRLTYIVFFLPELSFVEFTGSFSIQKQAKYRKEILNLKFSMKFSTMIRSYICATASSTRIWILCSSCHWQVDRSHMSVVVASHMSVAATTYTVLQTIPTASTHIRKHAKSIDRSILGRRRRWQDTPGRLAATVCQWNISLSFFLSRRVQ